MKNVVIITGKYTQTNVLPSLFDARMHFYYRNLIRHIIIQDGIILSKHKLYLYTVNYLEKKKMLLEQL